MSDRGMGTDLEPIDIRADGEALRKLQPRHRKFVIALLQQGASKHAVRKAAAESGYNQNYAFALMRDPGVIAALREEATKRVAGAALLGVTVMLDIATNPDHKDQFRAAKELAALNGFTAEQKITVQHIGETGQNVMAQIRQMAEQMGLDPRRLLEHAGIVDAEFTVVEAAQGNPVAEVDDSDW